MGKFYYETRDLKDVDLKLYFKDFKNPTNLKKIKEFPELKEGLSEILEYCKKIEGTQPVNLGFHLFKRYFIDGDRKSYEEKYFENRKRLHSKVLGYLFTKDSLLLKSLEEELYFWCTMYSWELPAHLSIDPTEIETLGFEPDESIGLFSAETAVFLSEIILLLDDELDSFLLSLIRREIKKRILDSYLKYTYWWEEADFNWSIVCSASLGITAIINIKDRQILDKIITRVTDSLSNFIKGFDEDGYCEEGLSYWEYGVSFLLYLADWIKFYSNGKIDILDTEKIQKILRLPLSVIHKDGTTLTFSDYTASKCINIPTFEMCNLLRKSGVYLKYSGEKKSIYNDHTFKFFKMLRYFKDYRRIESNEIEVNESQKIIFKSSQLYIFKNCLDNEYRCIAIKGGHNELPHNHNDLGSFILKDENNEIFIDLGAGMYCKDYFDDDKRYVMTACRSSYHNTLVIDGFEQKNGKNYFSKSLLKETKESYLIKFDLSSAYPINELLYNREISANKNITEISIKDSFDKKRKIEVIFITKDCPVLEEGRIVIKSENSIWFLSNSNSRYIVEEFEYVNHANEKLKRFRIKLLSNSNKTETIIKKG